MAQTNGDPDGRALRLLSLRNARPQRAESRAIVAGGHFASDSTCLSPAEPPCLSSQTAEN
jgi:hypothetical protein